MVSLAQEDVALMLANPPSALDNSAILTKNAPDWTAAERYVEF
jgi:hypothetical protein